MWVSPRWRIIYICPWACLTLFWCFWFCLFWFQEELIESSSDEESGPQDEKKSASVVDVEDLGNIMNSVKKAKVRFWNESLKYCTKVEFQLPLHYSSEANIKLCTRLLLFDKFSY